jgi:hypothetical protein
MLKSLFLKFTKPKIKFYINKDRAGSYPEPVPAKSCVPDWYKNASNFTMDKPVVRTPSGGAATTGTFKKCVPFLDAMTAGYIIRLQADVHVDIMPDKGPDFSWTLYDSPVVNFHTYDQVSALPGSNALPGGIPFKWMSYWCIETPPGYSCLFVQPQNHFEDRWEILPGIVDTDMYNMPVNFPMIWKSTKFKGIIKRGTPIAQVIPFKRESWQHEIVNNDPINYDNDLKKLSSKISDGYKSFWWDKKHWD